MPNLVKITQRLQHLLTTVNALPLANLRALKATLDRYPNIDASALDAAIQAKSDSLTNNDEFTEIIRAAQAITPVFSVAGWNKEAIYRASGSFTVPSGVTKLYVSMAGAGGGANNTNTGGSGSGSTLDCEVNVVPGEVISISVGASVIGSDGGDSHFGTYIICTGGKANNGHINTGEVTTFPLGQESRVFNGGKAGTQSSQAESVWDRKGGLTPIAVGLSTSSSRSSGGGGGATCLADGGNGRAQYQHSAIVGLGQVGTLGSGSGASEQNLPGGDGVCIIKWLEK